MVEYHVSKTSVKISTWGIIIAMFVLMLSSFGVVPEIPGRLWNGLFLLVASLVLFSETWLEKPTRFSLESLKDPFILGQTIVSFFALILSIIIWAGVALPSAVSGATGIVYGLTAVFLTVELFR